MKILEANGARIPALGLGTWQIRGSECAAIVSQALRNGYDHVDTAIMYENETAVGEGIRRSGRDRNEIFLTTKVWPSEVRDGLFQDAVQGSLQRLGVDNVDLLLIHWPPKEGAVSEWAGLLDEAVSKGWARHVGVSNFTSTQLADIVGATNNPVVCNQLENHPLLDQSIMRAACSKAGAALIAYCPLARGGELFENPIITDLCAKYEKSSAQIVLRWHVEHDNAGAIPKTATPDRLSENVAVFDFELTADDVSAISSLVTPGSRICDFEFSPEWD